MQCEAFDTWRLPKTENDYAKDFDTWHERDLTDLIRRDRNHACVIMWSVGNEIFEQGEPDGYLVLRRLVGLAKATDPMRPITAAFHYDPDEVVRNGLPPEVDLVGWNYKPAYYARLRDEHPHWTQYGGETCSAVSTRGVYHLPEPGDAAFAEAGATPDLARLYRVRHDDLQSSSYDTEGPDYTCAPDLEWHHLATTPGVFGEFVWTGFDYLGEPTPYGGQDHQTHGSWSSDWPSHSSYFGCVDLCGFAKDRYHLYRSRWIDADATPVAHLLPHWNWPGREGTTVPVLLYTNGDAAELFLNGRSLGTKTLGVDRVPVPAHHLGWEGADAFASPYRLGWNVPYEPGELRAVVTRGGRAFAEATVTTTGAATRLTLDVEPPDRFADAGRVAGCERLRFVRIGAADAEGRPVPTADAAVTLRVDGPGRLAAVGNGNPLDLTPFGSDTVPLFSGLALAVVAYDEDADPASVRLTVAADGLAEASATLG